MRDFVRHNPLPKLSFAFFPSIRVCCRLAAIVENSKFKSFLPSICGLCCGLQLERNHCQDVNHCQYHLGIDHCQTGKRC